MSSERNKERVKCECGVTTRRDCLKRHLKTKTHNRLLEMTAQGKNNLNKEVPVCGNEHPYSTTNDKCENKVSIWYAKNRYYYYCDECRAYRREQRRKHPTPK